MRNYYKLILVLPALISTSLFAQSTNELKKRIEKKDINGAFKVFVSSKRGSSNGVREVAFRASLLERMGHFHLAAQERARFASSRGNNENDTKLGNLSLILGRYNPVLSIPRSRSAQSATSLRAASALGLFHRGEPGAAATVLPANSQLLNLSGGAATYQAWLGAAGIHFSQGRLESSMNLLGAEFQRTPNFDLGVIRLQRARLLFDAQRYADVLDELLYLPKTSASWYQGQLVGAWSAYHLKDYNLALGLLMNLNSPFLAKKFNPESFLLESAVLYNLCYYESSKRSLTKLRQRYKSVASSIQRFRSYVNQPTQLMNVLGGYARGKTLAQKGIPQSDWDLIIDGLLTEQVMSDLDRSLTWAANEKSWVEKNLSSGQFSSLRSAYLKALSSANSEYYSRAAKFTAGLLNRMSLDVRESLEGALAVEVEINTRIRDRLLTGKTPQRKKIDFDAEVEKGFEFWPFEGEFWRDETGSYAFATTDMCEGRK